MNRRIRRKINKRAENRLMNFMAAHSDIRMSVRCRWMTTLDVENRYQSSRRWSAGYSYPCRASASVLWTAYWMS